MFGMDLAGSLTLEAAAGTGVSITEAAVSNLADLATCTSALDVPVEAALFGSLKSMIEDFDDGESVVNLTDGWSSVLHKQQGRIVTTQMGR
jgi:hypothetical protein